MRPALRAGLLVLALLPLSLAVGAAAEPDAPPEKAPPAKADAPPAEVAPDPAAGSADGWDLYGGAYVYFLPDDENFTIPMVLADRGRLHLEARYNYEALETASVFAGMNFEWADRVTLAFTPILGYAFGAVEGIVPGFEATLGYESLELYSEFEYFVDLEDSEGNFLYSWSELSWTLADRFRVGLTTQRTKVFDSERSVERGLLLGYDLERVSFTAHLFNPGDDDHFIVFAVDATF